MLFQIFMILQLFVGLNNVHGSMKAFSTDTKIFLELNNVGKIPACICTSGTCRISEDMQENICSAFQKRFEDLGNDNPIFMYCEIDDRTCYQANGKYPAKFHLNIIFDQFSLVSSSFWMGTKMYTPMMESIFRNKDFPHDWLSKLQLQTVKTSVGKFGMPVEYTGVMNYNTHALLKFYFCASQHCLESAEKFCDDYIYYVRRWYAQIAPYYLGCRVRRFYVEAGRPRVAWTAFYDYLRLVQSGFMDSVAKMRYVKKQLEYVIPSDWLKSYLLQRIVPFDFCEISAKALTTRRYYDEFKDPFSLRTRVAAGEHYRMLMQQIAAGDNKCPSCFRFPTEIRFSNVSNYARMDMTLFVSGSCFNRQGVHSCEAITEEIKRQWKRGSDIVPNDMAPKYEFKLIKGYPWLK